MKRSGLKKRGMQTRKRFPVIFIVCEGEETEPKYFSHFNKRYSGAKVRIKTSLYKNAEKLVKNAETIIGKNIYAPEDGDTMWCVFDCDANTDEALRSAFAFAKKHGYKIIFSNPCFELWFLLHYIDQNGYLKDCDAVLKKLTNKDKLPGYHKNTDVYQILLPMQNKAIMRASNRYILLKKRNKQFLSRSSNPATNVFSIVEYLNQI